MSRTRVPTSGKRFRAGLHRFNRGIGARKSLTDGCDSRSTVSRDAIFGLALRRRGENVVRAVESTNMPRAFQLSS